MVNLQGRADRLNASLSRLSLSLYPEHVEHMVSERITLPNVNQ